MESLVSMQKTTHKTRSHVKVESLVLRQETTHKTDFAIKGSGRLGVERLSLVSRQETARPTLQ